MGLRAGLDWCGKSRPTGIRSPDRPARRQSLYRLRYPAHVMEFIPAIYCRNVMLTTSFHLVLTLGIHGAIPLLPLYTFMRTAKQ